MIPHQAIDAFMKIEEEVYKIEEKFPEAVHRLEVQLDYPLLAVLSLWLCPDLTIISALLITPTNHLS